MIDSNVKDVMEAVGGTLVVGKPHTRFRGITIDSRTLQPDQLFFCINGKNFDGHDFIQEAFNKKAAGIVFSDKEKLIESNSESREGIPFLIQVDDSLRALQDYARNCRRRIDPKVVAITGTNGKSTTKEMTSAIAETRFSVLKTQGNFNNHIGLPLTLFNLEDHHQVLVLEMGMSAGGEIRRLAEISEPDIGIITNVSEAHLVHLKNIKKVQSAKGELFRSLSQKGTAIVNADDPMVLELAQSLRSKIITYAVKNSADVRACEIESRGNKGYDVTLSLFESRSSLFIPCPGRFNIYNALASIAASFSLGVSIEKMNDGLQNTQMPGQRMEFIPHKTLVLINDTYNANPRSMLEALGFLVELQTTGRRFLVIGDMLELGDIAEKSHRQLGVEIAKRNIDYLITVGPLTQITGEEAETSGMETKQIISCQHQEEAVTRLKNLVKDGDCLLFKGSRSTEMEKVIERLTAVKGD